MPAHANHRSPIDIQADMLTLALEGVRSTQMLMACNVSSTQYNIFVKRLLRCGLLRRYESVLVTTEKGRKFLHAYAVLAELTGQHGRIAPEKKR